MLRSDRPGDAEAVSALLSRAIAVSPPGGAWDRERLNLLIRRLSRWDARGLLWIASALGRPVFRTFVDDVNGTVLGAIVWTPGRRAGWVAAIGLDPRADRLATLRSLLDRCGEESRRHGLSALLIPGAILPDLAIAAARPEALGFTPVGSHDRWFLGLDGTLGPGRAIRPTRRYSHRDGRSLEGFARAGRPAGLEAIEPVRSSDLSVSPIVARALGSTTIAFVHDGPQGPDAFARATCSSARQSAHLSLVLDPNAPPDAGRAVLGSSIRWCGERSVEFLTTETAEGNVLASELLREAGFSDAERWTTWARTVDGST
jgi:hypothetical protein